MHRCLPPRLTERNAINAPSPRSTERIAAILPQPNPWRICRTGTVCVVVRVIDRSWWPDWGPPTGASLDRTPSVHAAPFFVADTSMPFHGGGQLESSATCSFRFFTTPRVCRRIRHPLWNLVRTGSHASEPWPAAPGSPRSFSPALHTVSIPPFTPCIGSQSAHNVRRRVAIKRSVLPPTGAVFVAFSA